MELYCGTIGLEGAIPYSKVAIWSASECLTAYGNDWKRWAWRRVDMGPADTVARCLLGDV